MAGRARADAMTHVTRGAASVPCPFCQGKIPAGHVIASFSVIVAARWHDAKVLRCVIGGLCSASMGVLGGARHDAYDGLTPIAPFFQLYPHTREIYALSAIPSVCVISAGRWHDGLPDANDAMRQPFRGGGRAHDHAWR